MNSRLTEEQQRLAVDHIWLAHATIDQFRYSFFDMMDIESDAMFGLVVAAKGYKDNLGEFERYARVVIFRLIRWNICHKNITRRLKKKKRKMLSLSVLYKKSDSSEEEYIGWDAITPQHPEPNTTDNRDFAVWIHKIIPPRLSKFFVMRFEEDLDKGQAAARLGFCRNPLSREEARWTRALRDGFFARVGD